MPNLVWWQSKGHKNGFNTLHPKKWKGLLYLGERHNTGPCMKAIEKVFAPLEFAHSCVNSWRSCYGSPLSSVYIAVYWWWWYAVYLFSLCGKEVIQNDTTLLSWRKKIPRRGPPIGFFLSISIQWQTSGVGRGHKWKKYTRVKRCCEDMDCLYVELDSLSFLPGPAMAICFWPFCKLQ